jgi:beta-galactosidase
LGSPGSPALAFGGDYNPEQWSEETWAEDVRLMREAGVNLVSVGIFSWSLLEPSEGVYEFGWLDRVLELLHANGVRVDLANATASPPPWFSHKYPQSLPVTADGVRHSYGSRQAFAASSPAYRRAAAALTERIAGRYREHPAVVMWHVHNEYGCHNQPDYSDGAAAGFRSWLERRYGSLDGLNSAWGTAFWSQRYSAWQEIMPPRTSGTWVNPTQQLDFARYSSYELLECYKAEAAIIRSHSPHPVTTNFMGFSMGLHRPVDYWRWAEQMDVVANDHYLAAEDPRNFQQLAATADLTRGWAKGRPWLLMEHSTSAVNWQPRNIAKAPGEMLRDSLQHVARGSTGRSSSSGGPPAPGRKSSTPGCCRMPGRTPRCGGRLSSWARRCGAWPKSAARRSPERPAGSTSPSSMTRKPAGPRNLIRIRAWTPQPSRKRGAGTTPSTVPVSRQISAKARMISPATG